MDQDPIRPFLLLLVVTPPPAGLTRPKELDGKEKCEFSERKQSCGREDAVLWDARS